MGTRPHRIEDHVLVVLEGGLRASVVFVPATASNWVRARQSWRRMVPAWIARSTLVFSPSDVLDTVGDAMIENTQGFGQEISQAGVDDTSGRACRARSRRRRGASRALVQ